MTKFSSQKFPIVPGQGQMLKYAETWDKRPLEKNTKKNCTNQKNQGASLAHVCRPGWRDDVVVEPEAVVSMMVVVS